MKLKNKHILTLMGTRRFSVFTREMARDFYINAGLPIPSDLQGKWLIVNHSRKAFRRNKYGKVYQSIKTQPHE